MFSRGWMLNQNITQLKLLTCWTLSSISSNTVNKTELACLGHVTLNKVFVIKNYNDNSVRKT